MAKRRVLKRVIVFLLLGAIVNVAVAWGCAAWIDATRWGWTSLERQSAANGNWELQGNHRAGAVLYVSLRFDDEQMRKSGDLGRAPDGFWPSWCDSTFSSRVESGSALIENRIVDARGWPLICMWSERIRWHQFAGPINDEVTGGITISTPPRVAGAYTVMENARVIPLFPIWPGFAINTIFYAAVLWMLFAFPFTLRRHRRRKRGLCPACAYPIGTSPVCTECGKPVTPHQSQVIHSRKDRK